MGKYLVVDVDRIDQDENSRVIYKDADLSELMASMKQDGLLQPVGLRAKGNKRYEAVFGNRRLLAAKKLGWATIDATLVDAETDNDRDILNLVENFKRQNTSMAEDGRMFKVLMDRGLSKKEIAARLGIRLERVDLGLEAIEVIPRDLQRRIVNTPQGKSTPQGKIPASAARAIINLKRTQKLNVSQTRKLLEFASNKGTLSQVTAVAPLMRSGISLNSAINLATRYREVQFRVMVDVKTAEAYEKRTGITIVAAMHDYLSRVKEFGVLPLKRNGVGRRREIVAAV